MASYTKDEMNQKLAKDIWSEKLGVAYEDIGKDYGKYTDGSGKLILSKDLLGGGKEDSTKLAAVMGHEGSHYYGNKLEGIAHAQGYDTYAQINKIFNLEGDSSFVNSMLDGILSKESWVANTGDTQHWKLAKTENGGWGWKEDGSLDFNIDTSDPAMHLLLAGDPKLKQLFREGDDKNTHTMTYEDMKDNVGKVGFALNGGMDGPNIKNLMNFVGGTQHLANASTSANNVMALLAKDGNKTITPQERVQISNTLGVFMDSLYNAQNSGLLVKNEAQYIPDNRLLQQDGLTFPMALNTGETYFRATSLYGRQMLINQGDETIRWRPHPQYDIANQIPGISNALVATKDGLSYKLNYAEDFGLNYEIKENGNAYQRLSHMYPESIMSYLGTFGTKGTSIKNNALQGIQQNMGIGKTGSTGMSSGIHLDYIQYSGGKKIDSFSTMWSFMGNTTKPEDVFNFKMETTVNSWEVFQRMNNHAPVWAQKQYWDTHLGVPYTLLEGIKDLHRPGL